MNPGTNGFYYDRYRSDIKNEREKRHVHYKRAGNCGDVVEINIKNQWRAVNIPNSKIYQNPKFIGWYVYNYEYLYIFLRVFRTFHLILESMKIN